MCFIAMQWGILIWSWGKPWSWASGQYPWVRTSVFAQAGLLRKSVWFMEAQEIALFWKACAASLLPDAQSHENNCLNAKCNLITRPKAPHLWSDRSPSCVCEWFPWLHSPGSEAPAALVRERCPVLSQDPSAEVAEEDGATSAWGCAEEETADAFEEKT